MATVKTPGLVLQRIVYGDTSLILKVYTSEQGLVTFMAKGARSAKSKFRALVDFFLLIQWVHPAFGRGEIRTLHDASLMEDMPSLRTSAVKQALGQVWFEIYLRFSPASGESTQRFDWIMQHLQSLNASDVSSELPFLSIDFLMGFCHLSGYAPQFQYCVHCGSLVQGPRLRMHLDLGGPVCERCRREEGATLPLSAEAARLIEKCEYVGMLQVTAPFKVCQAAEGFLWTFLNRHAGEGRHLKAMDVYHSLLNLI
jgi:DNA repair protein RecO